MIVRMKNVPVYSVLFLDPVSLVHLLFSSVTLTVVIAADRASGHFQLPFALSQNESLTQTIRIKNLLRLQTRSHANQSSFYMKSFARGLVLKQRYKLTRNWPAVVCKPALMKVAAIALANVYPHTLLSHRTWVPITAFSEIHFTSLAPKTCHNTPA